MTTPLNPAHCKFVFPLLTLLGSTAFAQLPVPRNDPTQRPQGSLVGWGRQTFGIDLSGDFVGISAGEGMSWALRGDGSVIFWGYRGQGSAEPFIHSDYVAIDAGYSQRIYCNLGRIRSKLGDSASTGRFDGDGLVDLLDHFDLVSRLAGPNSTPHPERWRFLDLDDDYDVDLADFRVSQNHYTGSSP